VSEPDPIARFDGKTISYTYDNGWAFSNTFEGNIRVTDTPRRGELREPVQIRELRPNVFLVSWIDGEMGLIAQIIDLENATVLATIPSEDDAARTEIITATISSFDG
jgi:MoaF-like